MPELKFAAHKQDVLVALLPNPRDLEFAEHRGWYRVRPGDMLNRIKGGLQQFTHLAFYQPDSFKSERRCVRRFARIVDISNARRVDLLPEQPDHPRANELYVRFNLGEIQILPHPIISARGRRILFIPSNWERIAAADDINDLFVGSPIEDSLYRRLRNHGLLPEREFFLDLTDPNNPNQSVHYCFDMAIFCRDRTLDIECDGDMWHTRPDRIQSDNDRDNLVQANRWHVLRFNTAQIRDKQDDTFNMVREAVNKYGGVIQPDQTIRYFSKDGRLRPGQTEMRFPE